jgi:hypothetical protein
MCLVPTHINNNGEIQFSGGATGNNSKKWKSSKFWPFVRKATVADQNAE